MIVARAQVNSASEELEGGDEDEAELSYDACVQAVVPWRPGADLHALNWSLTRDATALGNAIGRVRTMCNEANEVSAECRRTRRRELA